MTHRYIWNAIDGSFVKKLEGHKAAVACCSWSNNDMLISGKHPSAAVQLHAAWCVVLCFSLRRAGDRAKTVIVWGL